MKNKIIKIFIGSIIFSIGIISCRIDPPIPPAEIPEIDTCNCAFKDSCSDENKLPPRPHGYIWSGDTYHFTPDYLGWASFNPNNADEIVYYKGLYSFNPQVIKFNLVSKQKQVLYEGALLSAPLWSRKGYILLNKTTAQVFRMKDNGDSLIQLTSGATNYLAEWNYQGDKFITEHFQQGSITNTAIFDFDGNLLDTIPGITYHGSWQNQDNKFLYSEYGGRKTSIYDLNTHTSTVLVNNGETGEYTGIIQWFPDGKNVLAVLGCGIQKLNIHSKNSVCLRRKCKNDFYSSATISELSGKILFIKEHRYEPEYENIYLTNKLILMNLDGSNPQEINLN